MLNGCNSHPFMQYQNSNDYQFVIDKQFDMFWFLHENIDVVVVVEVDQPRFFPALRCNPEKEMEEAVGGPPVSHWHVVELLLCGFPIVGRNPPANLSCRHIDRPPRFLKGSAVSLAP